MRGGGRGMLRRQRKTKRLGRSGSYSSERRERGDIGLQSYLNLSAVRSASLKGRDCRSGGLECCRGDLDISDLWQTEK